MGTNLPVKSSCFEIIIVLMFLTLYLFIRIIGVIQFDIITSKSILCCGLIYFYYRSVFVYLPISPTLGPMLVKMKYMVRNDFITFLRMFIVFMAAGGITMNAIIYPYYPLNGELIKRVFLRAFFGLFITDKDDFIDIKDKCKGVQIVETKDFCSNVQERFIQSKLFNVRGTSNTLSLPEDKYTCPNPSLVGWVILIQYLLLVKLFLTTLLTAMFSHTKAKVDAESDQIWMFQRYEIVIDYEQRLCLPPPLTIISYAIMVFERFKRIIDYYMHAKHLFSTSRSSKSKRKPMVDEEDPNISLLLSKHHSDHMTTTHLGRQNPNKTLLGIRNGNNTLVGNDVAITEEKIHDHSNYWKMVVQDYAKKIEDSTRDKDGVYKEQAISLTRLKEDFYTQKKNLKRLDDRVLSIERNLTVVASDLCFIKHFLTDQKAHGLNSVNTGQHIMSRQSPYPFSQLSRYPVYDNYVNWDVVYGSYDPPIINLDKNLTFVAHDIPLTDPDDLNLIELTATFFVNESNRESICEDTQVQPEVDTNQKTTGNNEHLVVMDELQSSKLDPDWNHKSDNQWNKITTCTIDNQTVNVDRTTWIIKHGFSLQYQIDTLGYPINPMGRTGARGRGALPRWGPNHEIRVIVTRWRKHNDFPTQTVKYVHVEGRRLLEFLACRDPHYGEWKLPGGKILGNTSQYQIVCTCFSELVFEKTNIDHRYIETEKHMKKFFSNFAPADIVKTAEKAKSSKMQQTHVNNFFSAKMIYKGYIDDPRNTDNSWVEAEIWNMHYDGHDKLNDNIPDVSVFDLSDLYHTNLSV